MTVETQTSKVTANGNGIATSFSFSPMVLTRSSDLRVTYVAADGTETTLSEGTGTTNYAVVVSVYPGTGSITYPASLGTVLPLGASLVMKRVLTLEQATDFENQGGYHPEVLEGVLDRGVMVDLQQQETINRAIRIPVAETMTAAQLTLPVVASRANKVLGFNASGEVIATSGGLTGVPASSYSQTLLGLTSAGAWAAALGVLSASAFIQTLLDDVDAATARATLGIAQGTTAAQGILELATDAETRTGTDTARAITPSNLTAKEATSAEFLANTADRILTTDVVWASAAEVALTDAATITVDMGTFINAVVTLGGNRTLGNPTNEKVGQGGVIRIVQDATGSRTLAYGTDWEFAGGTAPILSTAANAQDLLFYHVIATDRIYASLAKATA